MNYKSEVVAIIEQINCDRKFEEYTPGATADLFYSQGLADMKEEVLNILNGITPNAALDPYTIERLTKAIARANDTLPNISTDRMRGDNLAIILCTAFDEGDTDTEDDSGWSETARNGYEETIAAIREHYAATIRALGKGEG